MTDTSANVTDSNAREIAAAILEAKQLKGMVYPVSDLEAWSTLLAWDDRMPKRVEGAAVGLGGDNECSFVASDRDFRLYEGRVILRFDCSHHGFAGLNVPGTHVHCGRCGQPLFASIVDLIFSDIYKIKPLADDQGFAQCAAHC